MYVMDKYKETIYMYNIDHIYLKNFIFIYLLNNNFKNYCIVQSSNCVGTWFYTRLVLRMSTTIYTHYSELKIKFTANE